MFLFSVGDCRFDNCRDSLGYFVLKLKDIFEVAVVSFGPDVMSGLGIDQLRGDTQPPARLAHAALDDVART